VPSESVKLEYFLLYWKENVMKLEKMACTWSTGMLPNDSAQECMHPPKQREMMLATCLHTMSLSIPTLRNAAFLLYHFRNSSISESQRSDPAFEPSNKTITWDQSYVDCLDLFFADQYLIKPEATRFPPKT
jgi:hypothetical protein